MKRVLLATAVVFVACDPVPVDDAGSDVDAGFADDESDAGFADAGFVDAGFVDGGFVEAAPAWWESAPIDAFVEIAGTNDCGVTANAYSGFTLKPDTAELFFLAVGGHNDSSDNRVVSIGLLEDQPRWQLRNPPSTRPIENAGYYDDGDGTPLKPGSTHTYDYTAWIPEAQDGEGRLMRFGMHGTWPSGFDSFNVDGFNPRTNAWDPPGTYPDVPGNAGTTVDRDTGTVYAAGGGKKWVPDATSWADATLGTARFPNAWDSTRHAIFGLQWADGQGFGDAVLTAVLNTPSTSTRTAITLEGPALDQFVADAPQYAGMDFDPENDVFLFYVAKDVTGADVVDRIYRITPNDTTTWTIDLFPLSSTETLPEPAPASGAGINGRFKYIAQLHGFVLLPNQNSNLFFLRTAP